MDEIKEPNKEQLEAMKEAAAYFGRIGGKKAAKTLTKEQRTERAKKAGKAGALKRWANHVKKS